MVLTRNMLIGIWFLSLSVFICKNGISIPFLSIVNCSEQSISGKYETGICFLSYKVLYKGEISKYLFSAEVDSKWLCHSKMCMYICRIIALKYALTSLVNLSDPLVTGVLAYLWKNQRDEWSQSILSPYRYSVHSVSLKYGHLQHTPYYFYLFRKTPYSTETVIYRGQHFIFLWKPEFSLTPLFVQKQSGWITHGHPIETQHSTFWRRMESWPLTLRDLTFEKLFYAQEPA